MTSLQQHRMFDQVRDIVDAVGDQRAIEALVELHKEIFNINYSLVDKVAERSAEFNDEEIIGDPLAWYLEGMTAVDFYEDALAIDSRIDLLIGDIFRMVEEDLAC